MEDFPAKQFRAGNPYLDLVSEQSNPCCKHSLPSSFGHLFPLLSTPSNQRMMLIESKSCMILLNLQPVPLPVSSSGLRLGLSLVVSNVPSPNFECAYPFRSISSSLSGSCDHPEFCYDGLMWLPWHSERFHSTRTITSPGFPHQLPHSQ